MRKVLIPLFFTALLSCSDEDIPLIENYQAEWQLDVGSQFIEGNTLPVVRPVGIDYKVTADGSLLMIFNKEQDQSQLGTYFITKVSPGGQIVKTVDLPSGYSMADIQHDEKDGYVFTMTNDYTKPDFIQLRISSNLDVTQTAFTFNRPVTFHTLKFSETGIFLSQYEGQFPGTRVTRYNYEEQQQWSVKYNSPYIRPFPYLEQSRLFFLQPNYVDSLTITSINDSNGAVEWTRSYTSGELFGVENLLLINNRFIDGVINVSAFDSQNHIFYLAQINPSNGRVRSRRSTNTPSESEFVSLGTITQDGGYIFRYNDTNSTYLFKTDRSGKVGWTGEFLDGGVGMPVETPSGDLYVVSDGYVFKLRAIR